MTAVSSVAGAGVWEWPVVAMSAATITTAQRVNAARILFSMFTVFSNVCR